MDGGHEGLLAPGSRHCTRFHQDIEPTEPWVLQVDLYKKPHPGGVSRVRAMIRIALHNKTLVGSHWSRNA